MDGESKQKAVKILFPGLTHGGKIYDYGEIEESPDAWLIEAANKRTKLFHRDSKKDLRIARLINVNDDYEPLNVNFEDDDDEATARKPAYRMVIMDSDLEGLTNKELMDIANNLGLIKNVSKNFNKDKLQKFITLMRRI